MAEWSFLVPPDIAVTLRASRRPALLARCLGPETTLHDNPALLLDLGAAPGAHERTARGRYKGIPWSLGVTNTSEGFSLSWRSPLLREYLALHIALLPALRLLLLKRDVALVTGAAFESRGDATLLSGDTGAGKTAALLAALDRGARLIGDEYVGISATGDVTPVLRVLALRSATLASAPELPSRLSPQRRFALRLASVAARLSGRRLDPLVHVSPEELGLSTTAGTPTRLSTLCWLERSPRTHREEIDRIHAVDALASAQDAHDRAYGVPDALAYDSTHWRDTLARGLAGARCLRLAGSLSDEILSELVDGQAQPAARPSP